MTSVWSGERDTGDTSEAITNDYNNKNRFIRRLAISPFLALSSPKSTSVRDAPLDIWGGGPRVFIACKLFFYLREKTLYFFGDQRPTLLFFCFVGEIVCRMLSLLDLCSLRYHLVFFLVNIFFINFDKFFLFLPTFSTNFFFSDFCGDKLFFSFFF